MAKAKVEHHNSDSVTNGGENAINFSLPFQVNVTVQGSSDFFFHRWNPDAVDAKAKAAKNSAAKKSDDVESYVYRLPNGELAIPGEYFRQSLIHSAKFKADPRSPRKSAMDLFKAGVITLTPLCTLGKVDWDYLDRRRVMVQRQGINRTRPAMSVGWKTSFTLQILTPEYVSRELLRDTLEQAGRLIGVGDNRPTYGRFGIVAFE